MSWQSNASRNALNTYPRLSESTVIAMKQFFDSLANVGLGRWMTRLISSIERKVSLSLVDHV